MVKVGIGIHFRIKAIIACYGKQVVARGVETEILNTDFRGQFLGKCIPKSEGIESKICLLYT